jgi:hypothetical protein
MFPHPVQHPSALLLWHSGQSAATKDKTEDQARMIERRAARMIIQGAKVGGGGGASWLLCLCCWLYQCMQAERRLQ